jgi:hypothetical protein
MPRQSSSGDEDAGLPHPQPHENETGQFRPAAFVPAPDSPVKPLLAEIKALQMAGREGEARTLLYQVIAQVPDYDTPWLRLLGLVTSEQDEHHVLEGFLRQHPQHPFADALHTRLDQLRPESFRQLEEQ